MYMFLAKHGYVFAKTCTSFPKNMYMFWRAPASKISPQALARKKIRLSEMGEAGNVF